MKKIIYQYYGYTFFRNLSFYSAVLIPFFTTWGHISLLQTQFLQSWSMIWIFMLEVPTGIVADRFGRKYALLLGSIIVAFAVLIYGSIPNFQVFLMCEFLFALSMSLTSGSDEALVYDTLKEFGHEKESKKIFGQAYFFRLGGVLVASLVGGVIANYFGINAAMRAAAIPFFIAAVIAWQIKEPKFREETDKSSYFQILREGWNFFIKHKTLRLLSLDSILVASAAYFVFWLYQPLLQKLGIPLVFFGVFGAVLMLVQMIVSANFSALEKLFGSTKRLLQLSALATAGSFFLVALIPNVVTVVIFLLVGGGFGLTRATLMSAYINHYIPSQQRATILSFLSLFRRLFLAVLAPFVGLAAEHTLQLPLFLIGLLPLSVFLFSPIEKEMFN
jgi:MFS family permease